MTNELSKERAIEALYTVRAYYASLTAGYPKGKDCRGIGDVMCSEIANSCLMAIKALEQQPSRKWKEIYAESEGSNSWIEFKCPHCGHSFGMESGEYDWHYGDEIPWKYCPICGGSAEHNPYMEESEE